MEAGPAEQVPLNVEGQELVKEEPLAQPPWWRRPRRAGAAAALALLVLAAAAAALRAGGARNLSKAEVASTISEVANGEQISLSEWHQRRDFVANIRTGGSICTGIVSGNKVITAKHCADGGTKASSMQVMVSSKPNTWQRVQKIDLHPTLDVAVLTFSGNHRNSKQVVLDSVVPEVGERMRLCGFGTNHKGHAGRELHDTRPLQRTHCNFKDGVICAGSGAASGTSSCGGDSGGPWFQMRNNAARVEVVGVNSFGFGGTCGEPSKETGIVSVAAAKSFLQRVAPDFTWDAPSKCTDADNGAKDNDGDTCAWYTEHDRNGNHCGKHDDGDFKANTMCCRCGGGNGPEATTCRDTDNGAKDSDGDGCGWYTHNDQNQRHCGRHDDGDFKAKRMCCKCGGGRRR